jgi:hypothetical protein
MGRIGVSDLGELLRFVRAFETAGDG